MKKVLYYSMISFVLIGLFSCNDDSPSLDVKKETLTMGAGYANDIYYSLKNGVVAEVSRTNWDVAFSVAARSSSVLINAGAGVTLKEFSITAGWQWSDALDTTGYSTWDYLYNSDETWDEGAFGRNATGHPNYGWGEYNSTSHDVDGVALFIIKLVNGDFKKIFIEKKSAVKQQYTFKYADLDGANEMSKTVSFADATSNFIYYSIVDDAIITDREPDATTWDLLITKYTDNTQVYNVVGVLQNIGVKAIDRDNVTDLNSVLYLDTEFVENISTIGADWKIINHQTYTYDIDLDRMFFVLDNSGKAYKIVFTGFDLTTGTINFDLIAL